MPDLPEGLKLRCDRKLTGPVIAMVRPENSHLASEELGPQNNVFAGRVVRCISRFDSFELEVNVGVMLVVSLHRAGAREPFRVGEELHLYIPPQAVCLLPPTEADV